MKKTRSASRRKQEGYLSKAINRMTSQGIASPTDPQAVAALKAKYPERKESLPGQVIKCQAVESMKTLRDAILSLRHDWPDVAPGSGQLRPEFLKVLEETWEDGDPHWELFESFALRCVHGSLSAWSQKCCLTVETVGMYKKNEQDKNIVRPIGMRNPLYKVIYQNADIIRDFLEPQQLGMSKAGGVELVHVVRMKLEQTLYVPNWTLKFLK